MIFQHTWEKVLSGKKTQTRRLVKAGDYGWICGRTLDDKSAYSEVCNQGESKIITRWQRGHTYAVQPGRGKPAVARIRVTDIRREDVRRISEADAWAEGFSITPKYEFLQVWTRMHDKGIGEWLFSTEYDPVLPDHCPLFLLSRPAERYTAWVLTFEVVK